MKSNKVGDWAAMDPNKETVLLLGEVHMGTRSMVHPSRTACLWKINNQININLYWFSFF